MARSSTGELRSPLLQPPRSGTMLALLASGFCLGLLTASGITGLGGERLSSAETVSQTPATDPLIKARKAIESRDYGHAHKLLTPLAEEGRPAAQTTLAELFSGGLGTPRSHTEAYRWYRLAAEQDDAAAQLALAALYAHGYGVEQDLARAAHWSGRARTAMVD